MLAPVIQPFNPRLSVTVAKNLPPPPHRGALLGEGPNAVPSWLQRLAKLSKLSSSQMLYQIVAGLFPRLFLTIPINVASPGCVLVQSRVTVAFAFIQFAGLRVI